MSFANRRTNLFGERNQKIQVSEKSEPHHYHFEFGYSYQWGIRINSIVRIKCKFVSTLETFSIAQSVVQWVRVTSRKKAVAHNANILPRGVVGYCGIFA